MSAILRMFGPSTELKKPFLAAPLALALATTARLSLEPFVHSRDPFLFFAIAVVIAALYGGFRAGIATTLLSIPVCDYLFIDPRYTWFIYDARADSVMLALFAILGLLTTAVIHSFHRTRRQLGESLADLQQSEAKLEIIAATVPEILFAVDSDGGVEYLNEQFSKYTGRELPEGAGRGWFEFLHPDDRRKMEAALSRCLESGNESEIAVRLRRSDGLYRWFKWHAQPLRDSTGKVDKLFGVCSDIDSEKTLTEAFESRTQELLRLNEGLERFAYAASHDLQEPLRTVGAMTSSFLKRAGGELDEQSTEALVSIVKGVERMRRLIHDIMDFARAGNSGNAFGAVDTHAVVEIAISNLGQAIRESRANMIVGDLPVVRGVESAVLRLFQNLIANAIKYRGDTEPQIQISASEREGVWLFSIKDNGIGIDGAYHEKIFEPFRRLHPRSKYEGTGLGLASCRHIVQALGGRIWVESQPGEGSTFFFNIPRHADAENAEAERNPLVRDSSDSSNLPPDAHVAAGGRYP